MLRFSREHFAKQGIFYSNTADLLYRFLCRSMVYRLHNTEAIYKMVARKCRILNILQHSSICAHLLQKLQWHLFMLIESVVRSKSDSISRSLIRTKCEQCRQLAQRKVNIPPLSKYTIIHSDELQ